MPYDVIMGGIKGRGSSLLRVCLLNAGVSASVSSACQRATWFRASPPLLLGYPGKDTLNEKPQDGMQMCLHYKIQAECFISVVAKTPQDYFKTLWRVGGGGKNHFYGRFLANFWCDFSSVCVMASCLLLKVVADRRPR